MTRRRAGKDGEEMGEDPEEAARLAGAKQAREDVVSGWKYNAYRMDVCARHYAREVLKGGATNLPAIIRPYVEAYAATYEEMDKVSRKSLFMHRDAEYVAKLEAVAVAAREVESLLFPLSDHNSIRRLYIALEDLELCKGGKDGE